MVEEDQSFDTNDTAVIGTSVMIEDRAGIRKMKNWLLNCLDSIIGLDWFDNLSAIMSPIITGPGQAVLGILGGFALLVFCVILATILKGLGLRPESSVNPTEDLLDFIRAANEISGDIPTTVDEIASNNFEAYSVSYCQRGLSLKNARDALSTSLSNAPEAVRAAVVTSALRKGVSGICSWKETKADLTNNGNTYSYLAFYSTAFKQEKMTWSGTYETCAMVTGVSFTAGETVVYKEKTEEYRPDHYSRDTLKRTEKTPVLERTTMTLKQQEELHHWMVQRAIESSAHLLYADYRNSIPPDTTGDSGVWYSRERLPEM